MICRSFFFSYHFTLSFRFGGRFVLSLGVCSKMSAKLFFTVTQCKLYLLLVCHNSQKISRSRSNLISLFQDLHHNIICNNICCLFVGSSSFTAYQLVMEHKAQTPFFHNYPGTAGHTCVLLFCSFQVSLCHHNVN